MWYTHYLDTSGNIKEWEYRADKWLELAQEFFEKILQTLKSTSWKQSLYDIFIENYDKDEDIINEYFHEYAYDVKTEWDKKITYPVLIPTEEEGFNFVKTNRKKYDLAIVLSYALLNEYLPEFFSMSSDAYIEDFNDIDIEQYIKDELEIEEYTKEEIEEIKKLYKEYSEKFSAI